MVLNTRPTARWRALVLSCSLALAALSIACSSSDGSEGVPAPGEVTTTGPITGVRNRTQDAVDSLNGQQSDLEERVGSEGP